MQRLESWALTRHSQAFRENFGARSCTRITTTTTTTTTTPIIATTNPMIRTHNHTSRYPFGPTALHVPSNVSLTGALDGSTVMTLAECLVQWPPPSQQHAPSAVKTPTFSSPPQPPSSKMPPFYQDHYNHHKTSDLQRPFLSNDAGTVPYLGTSHRHRQHHNRIDGGHVSAHPAEDSKSGGDVELHSLVAADKTLNMEVGVHATASLLQPARAESLSSPCAALPLTNFILVSENRVGSANMSTDEQLAHAIDAEIRRVTLIGGASDTLCDSPQVGTCIHACVHIFMHSCIHRPHAPSSTIIPAVHLHCLTNYPSLNSTA